MSCTSLTNGARYQGQTVKVCLSDVRRSVAIGDVLPSGSGKPQGSERPGQSSENGRGNGGGGSRERVGGVGA